MKKIVKIKMFVFDNKIILGLLLLSILIILKMSQLPYVFDSNFILKQLMETPSLNTKMYDMWCISENISLAFIASFIFYIFVSYIPQLRNENRAYCFIKYDLEMLDIEIVKLLTLFAYCCGNRKRLFNLCDEDIENLDKVELNNTTCNYYYTIWNTNINQIISKGTFSFNLYQELIEESNKIQNIVNEIMHKPCAAYYNQNLLEVFTVIRENKLLSIANNKLLEQIQNSEYVVAIPMFKEKFLNAFQVVCYFKNYNFKQIDCEIKEINKK